MLLHNLIWKSSSTDVLPEYHERINLKIMCSLYVRLRLITNCFIYVLIFSGNRERMHSSYQKRPNKLNLKNFWKNYFHSHLSPKSQILSIRLSRRKSLSTEKTQELSGKSSETIIQNQMREIMLQTSSNHKLFNLLSKLLFILFVFFSKVNHYYKLKLKIIIPFFPPIQT